MTFESKHLCPPPTAVTVSEGRPAWGFRTQAGGQGREPREVLQAHIGAPARGVRSQEWRRMSIQGVPWRAASEKVKIKTSPDSNQKELGYLAFRVLVL